MALKSDKVRFSKQNSGFVDVQIDNKNDKYLNLNLSSSSHKCSNVSTDFIQFNSKSLNTNKNLIRLQQQFVKLDSTVDGKDYSNFGQQSNKIGQGSKNYKLFNVNNETEENVKTKKWKNDSSYFKTSTSSSTLSLHIAAYENSIEADSVSNFGEIEGLKNERKSLGLITKQSNSFINSEAASEIQNSFEFPRQQSDNSRANNPGIMQFTTSQQLYYPNQPVPQRRPIRPMPNSYPYGIPPTPSPYTQRLVFRRQVIPQQQHPPYPSILHYQSTNPSQNISHLTPAHLPRRPSQPPRGPPAPPQQQQQPRPLQQSLPPPPASSSSAASVRPMNKPNEALKDPSIAASAEYLKVYATTCENVLRQFAAPTYVPYIVERRQISIGEHIPSQQDIYKFVPKIIDTIKNSQISSSFTYLTQTETECLLQVTIDGKSQVIRAVIHFRYGQLQCVTAFGFLETNRAHAAFKAKIPFQSETLYFRKITENVNECLDKYKNIRSGRGDSEKFFKGAMGILIQFLRTQKMPCRICGTFVKDGNEIPTVFTGVGSGAVSVAHPSCAPSEGFI